MNDRDREKAGESEPEGGLPPAVWITVLVAVVLIVLLFLLKRS